MHDLALVRVGQEHATRADGAGDDHRAVVAALRSRGASVEEPRWSDESVDWSGFAAAVVLGSSRHVADREAFVAWAGRIREVTAVWNPPDVLRWNTHRSYLLELEERGAPVVPTAWIARGDRVDLASLMDARRWTDTVLKPAVGGGSPGSIRVGAAGADLATAQRHLDLLADGGDVLVQPYLETVEGLGQRSVIVIDGQVSHGVRIRAHGDARGLHRHDEPPRVDAVDAETAALARWVVESTGTSLLCARVDLLQDALGSEQVVELSASAPDLHLSSDPHSIERLAEAVLSVVDERRSDAARTPRTSDEEY